MKNIKRKRLVNSLLLFLVVSFLMLFSPSVGKAQNNSTGCKYQWMWKWVWVWGNERNEATGRYELQYVQRYKYVYDCVPTVTQPNPTSSSSRNSSHPHTVRNADGTLRPANGYKWVNLDDPKDFRVELMPEFIAIKHPHRKGILFISDRVIETEKGAFRPAKGYRWVNPKDPNDIKVERIP